MTGRTSLQGATPYGVSVLRAPCSPPPAQPGPPCSPPCSASVRCRGRGSPAPGGTRPLPTPACALRTPSTQRVPGHERFCSESRASPHGCSLPGLSVGLGTQVQAGESVPRGPSASSPPWGQGATPGHWAWRRQGGAEGWGVRECWAENWGPGGGEAL